MISMPRHVLALGGLVDVLVVDPAPAVAGDLVAQLDEGGGHLGVALQRHRHAEDGQRQAAALELAQDAPDAHARAVLVDASMLRCRAGKAGGLNISDRNCSLPASPCSTEFSPPSS
jgi:CheY-like chemotaxis protein